MEVEGELKIKGQAELEHRKSKREHEDVRIPPFRFSLLIFILKAPVPAKQELEQRENELKEKALRNKVMRTRKSSA